MNHSGHPDAGGADRAGDGEISLARRESVTLPSVARRWSVLKEGGTPKGHPGRRTPGMGQRPRPRGGDEPLGSINVDFQHMSPTTEEN